MAPSGKRIRIGGVFYTSQEAQFLSAGIRSGMSRAEIRTVMREQFSRGLSSASFTEARRQIGFDRAASETMVRIGEVRTLPQRNLPKVQVIRPTSRFTYSAKVRARVGTTQTFIERHIRFGSDTRLDMSGFVQRASSILDKGSAQQKSALQLEEMGDIDVTENVAWEGDYD